MRAGGGGVFGDRIAVWSARRLIVVPACLGAEPELIDTDEDIFSVIGVATNWLIVCETSVRLHASQTELARQELGDVVIRTRWERPTLHVVDGRGREDILVVDGDRLVLSDA